MQEYGLFYKKNLYEAEIKLSFSIKLTASSPDTVNKILSTDTDTDSTCNSRLNDSDKKYIFENVITVYYTI